jgi:2-polyprenyl-3-methyl-5-hydroxy-6-metoxy-1,4-benzoquinol methylase
VIDWKALEIVRAPEETSNASDGGKDFALMSGERQFADRLENIREDHLSRYRFGLEHLGSSPGMGLDLFCGNGYGSYMIARQGHQVLGIDGSDEAISLANRAYGIDGTYFARKLWPFILPEVQFDFCFCLESIEHLENSAVFMDRVYNALKPGGILVLSTPNEDLMPFDPAQHKFHKRHYTCKQTLDLFRQRRMELVEWGGQMVYDLEAEGGQKLLEGDARVTVRTEGQFTIAIGRKPDL